MLITGTVPCSASSSSGAWSPVRIPIAWTKRDSTMRGVARRLAARQLQLVATQHDRVAAQLRDADLERDARPRRRRLEDQRDAAAGERVGGEPVRLQLGGAVEQCGQLVARKLGAGQEMASHPGIVLRLLTWNLLHGRDHPPNRALDTWRSRLTRRPERDATHVQVNQSLRRGFARLLAGWEWDVALLQEAPPRWLGDLERATGAAGALALTSRNTPLPHLRAAIADRNPDLIRSHEGGSNMLLVRPPARIVATATLELARRPERRMLLAARIELSGGRRVTVANAHLSVPSTDLGEGEALAAARFAAGWGGGSGGSSVGDGRGAGPLVLGGDLNLRPADHRAAFDALRDRFGLAPPTGPRAIDHLLARDLDVVARPAALPAAARELPGPGGLAIRLSDHAPVAAAFGLR